LPRLPENGEGVVTVAKLVRIRDENVSLTRGVLPSDVPAARAAEPPGSVPGSGPGPGPAGARHSARHAATLASSSARRSILPIRSAERRRWSAELNGPAVAGLVLHGIGGIGKSTLACQIASRIGRLGTERAVDALSGEVSAASLAAESEPGKLIILDNFDENLTQEPGGWTVRDPALAALLAGWTGKLLITCRLPFTLPGAETGRLAFRHVGPLTRTGAGELAMSLPALGQLTESEREGAWRLTAGHPRTMEYLDSVLARGARFSDVAGRITAAIEARAGRVSRAGSAELPEPTQLPAPVAEMMALAAGGQLFDELFDRLSPGARALLVRASVFRSPVPAGVLAARPGYLAECETAGLLTAGPGRELFVHRWTASELHRRLGEADLNAHLAAAHGRAAGYWRSVAAASPADQDAELEASYHQNRAGDLAGDPTPQGRPASAAPSRFLPADRAPGAARRLRRIGLTSAAAALAVFLAVELTDGPAASRPAVRPAAPERQSAPGPVAQAAEVRDQAAAWVARQISAGAILACDPAMCSALVRYGIPAANLLVLGPGASDPLGSAVVLATAAVRSMFGSRLVTVYAPQTLASFGTGQTRIDVRAIAPDGAAAYRTELAADLRARRAAGAQLLTNPRIIAPPAARTELANGEVDARLLLTLAAMAVSGPVRVLAFGDQGPGASMGTPLRSAEIVASAASAQALLAFVRAQRSPYLAAQSGLSPGPAGQTVLTIAFAAPSPLGLLQSRL
jgi:hypothetical protein